MKNFHPLSFFAGLGSGLVILILVFGGMRLIRGGQRSFTSNGNYQQYQGGAGGPNRARMAQRLGITEDELQKELDGGKTMQQIAQEHGLNFPMGNRGTRQSVSSQSSSGSTISSSVSAGASSSQFSSQ